MKKRLLITSIVMMLVVAVALSTATYAWFTSNASVTASQVTLTAATNEAASLGIGWTATGEFLPEIEATSPSGSTFAPAIPAALINNTTESDVAFATQFATPDENGDMVWLDDGDTANPYVWTNGEQTSFFVKNLSPANTISTVTLTATFTDIDTDDDIDAAALLRVGVVKKVSDSYKLLGVLAKETAYTYTAVTASTQMTAAAGTYFKKYLGQYVPAVPGTEAQVTSGAADYYRGTDPDNEDYSGATTATAGKFYTRAANTHNYAEVAYGEIDEGESVNDILTTASVTSIVVATDLEALDSFELKILVWEDGVALGDLEQGLGAGVSLNFTAGAASNS